MNRVTLGLVAAGLIAVAGSLGIRYTPAQTSYSVFAVEYTTLAELTKDSHFVVRGRVIKLMEAHRVSVDPPPTTPNPDGTPPTRDGRELVPIIPLGDPPKNLGLLETDVVVEVQSVLRGSGVAVGDLVHVAQLGGTNELGNFEGNEDDPLMQVGDETILFLRRSAQQPQRAFAVGITQGRFTIDSKGLLHSPDPSSPIAGHYEGKHVDALLADLKNL